MANNKKNEAITARDVDFAKWYTDVCRKAELMDYSDVKGFIIYRPYGYAMWEQIKKHMDQKFKELGHENVYMPMLIPQSLLQKEADHVEGFAPECAVVTKGCGSIAIAFSEAFRAATHSECSLFHSMVTSFAGSIPFCSRI